MEHATSESEAKRATFWSLADTLLRQGVQFAATIVLARLLTPSEFGVIAIASFFTATARVLADGGFAVALIQRPRLSQVEKSTAFWINLTSSIGLAVVVVLLASEIARFYDASTLAHIMPAVALSIPLTALGSVQTALLNRSLNLKPIALSGGIGAIGSGAVAIIMAWLGFGVWALAVQMILASALSTAVLWIASEWVPSFEFSARAARSLFRFGGFVFLAQISDTIYTRAYAVVLGRGYSAFDVGLYNRADSAQQFSVALLSSTINRITLPLFSRVAHDLERFSATVRRVSRLSMLANVPLMLGLAACAQPLVRLLFGPQWVDAVPVFQILSLAGLVWPLHVINLQILLSRGNSGRYFSVEVAKKPIGIGLLIGGAFFGIQGVALGQLVFAVIALVINTWIGGRSMGYGLLRQLADVLPITLIAAPLALAAYALSGILAGSPALAVLCGAILMGPVFLALAWIMRLQPAQDVYSMLRSRHRRGEEAGE